MMENTTGKSFDLLYFYTLKSAPLEKDKNHWTMPLKLVY